MPVGKRLLKPNLAPDQVLNGATAKKLFCQKTIYVLCNKQLLSVNLIALMWYLLFTRSPRRISAATARAQRRLVEKDARQHESRRMKLYCKRQKRNPKLLTAIPVECHFSRKTAAFSSLAHLIFSFIIIGDTHPLFSYCHPILEVTTMTPSQRHFIGMPSLTCRHSYCSLAISRSASLAAQEEHNSFGL